jgi:hypothetical protein
MIYRVKMLLVITSLLAALSMGCGAGSDDKKDQPQGVIHAHQLKALENAKAVKEIILDAQDEKQKALEKL